MGGAVVSQCVDALAKVANLEHAIEAQEKILWFDVLVDDMLQVEVGESIRYLINITRKMKYSVTERHFVLERLKKKQGKKDIRKQR
jgi:hypothetical protein